MFTSKCWKHLRDIGSDLIVAARRAGLRTSETTDFALDFHTQQFVFTQNDAKHIQGARNWMTSLAQALQ